MTGGQVQVQVVVYHLADDPVLLRRAYDESSRRLRGTPGLLQDELQQGVTDERSFAVVSRWRDWDAFAAWEASAGHRDQTAPMRPFRDHVRSRPFEIFRIVSGNGAAAATAAQGGKAAS